MCACVCVQVHLCAHAGACVCMRACSWMFMSVHVCRWAYNVFVHNVFVHVMCVQCLYNVYVVCNVCAIHAK